MFQCRFLFLVRYQNRRNECMTLQQMVNMDGRNLHECYAARFYLRRFFLFIRLFYFSPGTQKTYFWPGAITAGVIRGQRSPQSFHRDRNVSPTDTLANIMDVIETQPPMPTQC